MPKFTLWGIIATIICVILLSVFLASKIQVADASVAIPGMPSEPEPVTLLESMFDWLGDLDWNPFW